MSKQKVATETAVTESYTVLLSGEAEKLNPSRKGLLTFEIAMDNESMSLVLRLTGNGEGGLFSQEWITLDAIYAVLEQQNERFSSKVLRPLFTQGSTNNAGFLAAVLRSPDICLLEADGDKLFMHRCYPDWIQRLEGLTSQLTHSHAEEHE